MTWNNIYFKNEEDKNNKRRFHFNLFYKQVENIKIICVKLHWQLRKISGISFDDANT